MRIDVFTIFPQLVDGFAAEGLLGKARTRGLVDLRVHDPREHTTDVHRSVDDTPFGGGAGMVMRPEPIFAAVEAGAPPRPLLLLSASGRRFDQGMAEELAAGGGFSLLCGRYEGVDERVAEHLCDGELSIGDFVLNGGEVAALVVIEAVARLVPGVMGNEVSATEESFASKDGRAGLLEHPQYTRPADFRGWEVPEVLRSGDHARIARWRRAMALARTAERRPDLLLGPGWPDRRGGGRLGHRAPTALSSEVPIGASREPCAMNPTDFVDRASLRDDIPDFAPGDTVKVHVKVVEGNKQRVQVFQGHVIRRQGDGLRETYTVRKVSYGVGVERTFPRAHPDGREDRGRHPGRRPPGQALLPPGSGREGRQDQGEAGN